MSIQGKVGEAIADFESAVLNETLDEAKEAFAKAIHNALEKVNILTIQDLTQYITIKKYDRSGAIHMAFEGEMALDNQLAINITAQIYTTPINNGVKGTSLDVNLYGPFVSVRIGDLKQTWFYRQFGQTWGSDDES
jgi:hypothetical protein